MTETKQELAVVIDRNKNTQDAIEQIFSIFKNSVGQIKPHFMLTGPSGSGKTFFIKKILKEMGIDSIDVNTAQLTKEGYAGNSLSKVLTALGDENAGRPRVVIFDEMDKLFLSDNTMEAHANEITIGIQNELLHFLEADSTKTFGNYGHFNDTPCNRVMSVFLGAWNNQKDMTLNKLRKYGVKTELLGRIGHIYELDPIAEDKMIELLPNEPLLEKYLTLFTKVNKEHCIAEVSKYIKLLHKENAIGARLTHHLLHDYFINKGHIDKDKVKRLAFTDEQELENENEFAYTKME